MTNEEILRKAIEKAIKNGFKWKNEMLSEEWEKRMSAKEKLALCEEWLELDTHLTFIFSHDFGKAFWHYTEYWRSKDDKECWRYHQHQMLNYVQEGKEPLKYLERFLE